MVRNIIINFLEYVFVLLVILEFNTIYYVIPQVNFFYRNISLVVLFVLIILRARYFKIVPILIIYVLGSFLPFLNVRGEALLNYVKSFFFLMPMLIIYLHQCRKASATCYQTLLWKYSDIVFILASSSLILWLFATILGMIPPSMMIPNDWAGEDEFIPLYFGIYSETQEANLFGLSIIRNSGLFNEGPMYNMVLCLALSIECFIRNKRSKLKIIILVVTIITTFTTTGQLFLGGLLFFTLYKKFWVAHRFILIMAAPVIMGVMFTLFMVLMNDKQDTATVSYDARKADIETCIDVGLDNPFLGVQLYRTGEGSRLNYGFSNSLFTIFAHGGFYTLFLYVVALFCIPFVLMRYEDSRRVSIVILCYFCLFAITISHYKYLTFLMMAYGLSLYSFSYINPQRRKELNVDR